MALRWPRKALWSGLAGDKEAEQRTACLRWHWVHARVYVSICMHVLRAWEGMKNWRDIMCLERYQN